MKQGLCLLLTSIYLSECFSLEVNNILPSPGQAGLHKAPATNFFL